MRALEGKVAVITGSGQGVGRGIALYFASEGAKVITNNRKPLSEEKDRIAPGENAQDYAEYLSLRSDAAKVAEQIRREGGEAMPFFGDVTDEKTAEQLIEFAVKTYGRIDILVNNAAGLGQGTIEDTDEASWNSMTRAKMTGAFHTMHFAVPYMKAQGFGRILNCASNAWTGFAELDAYSAGNAGAVGLTWAAARELRKYNITVNAYCPQADSPGHVREFSRTVRTMEQRLGKPADQEALDVAKHQHGDARNIGPFLAYLCTDAAKDISGSVFEVTGAGRIALYSNPEVTSHIEKSEDPWTVEELTDTLPSTLLHNYQCPADEDNWGKQVDPVVLHGLFPRGEKVDGIPGEAYLSMLIGPGDPSGLVMGNVTFGEGVCNNFHTHDTWQVLIALSGLGYYEEEGKKGKLLYPGDVVKVAPNTVHRHGAAKGHCFRQLGLVLPTK